MKVFLYLFLVAAIFAACQSCKKDPTLPTVTTSQVIAITINSAMSGGRLTDDGNATILACGVCYSQGTVPVVTGDKTDDIIVNNVFTSHPSGLEPGKTYYLRAYTTNEVGTAYGETISFTTDGSAPTATTIDATNIGFADATLNGEINTSGIETTVTFIYGKEENNLNLSKVITSTKNWPTVKVSATLSDLEKSTTYFFALKAVNSLGAVTGETKSFKTFEGSTIDIDGNVYKTVKIGDQIWMTENLKVTHYNDGSEIPNVTDGNTWANLTSGAWCDYNNDAALGKIYGHLYNWFTVDTKKIAPQGWRVPSYEESVTLNTFVDVATGSGKLREIGTAHWEAPNTGATNETGFTALPNGLRSSDEHNGGTGNFGFLNAAATFWTSTEMQAGLAFDFCLYPEAITFGAIYNQYGFGIRLIKD